MSIEMVVGIVVIIFSIILHEVAHGFAAYLLGDPTAKYEGRLTLNPLPHIDILGTIIVPAFLFLASTGFIFGWAKPVPYNPYNLKGRYAETLVAAAGPMTNVGIALLFGVVYRLTAGALPETMLFVVWMIVFVNLFLAVLNLIPIPPLDGAKILSSVLPVRTRMALEEKVASVVNVNSIIFTIAVLLFIIFFLLDYIVLVVRALTALFTGAAV